MLEDEKYKTNWIYTYRGIKRRNKCDILKFDFPKFTLPYEVTSIIATDLVLLKWTISFHFLWQIWYFSWNVFNLKKHILTFFFLLSISDQILLIFQKTSLPSSSLVLLLSERLGIFPFFYPKLEGTLLW